MFRQFLGALLSKSNRRRLRAAILFEAGPEVMESRVLPSATGRVLSTEVDMDERSGESVFRGTVDVTGASGTVKGARPQDLVFAEIAGSGAAMQNIQFVAHGRHKDIVIGDSGDSDVLSTFAMSHRAWFLAKHHGGFSVRFDVASDVAIGTQFGIFLTAAHARSNSYHLQLNLANAAIFTAVNPI